MNKRMGWVSYLVAMIAAFFAPIVTVHINAEALSWRTGFGYGDRVSKQSYNDGSFVDARLLFKGYGVGVTNVWRDIVTSQGFGVLNVDRGVDLVEQAEAGRYTVEGGVLYNRQKSSSGSVTWQQTNTAKVLVKLKPELVDGKKQGAIVTIRGRFMVAGAGGGIYSYTHKMVYPRDFPFNAAAGVEVMGQYDPPYQAIVNNYPEAEVIIVYQLPPSGVTIEPIPYEK